MVDPANDIQEDALTHFLARVRFDARIFNHRRYCGDWAIDISGSGHVPFYLIDKGRAWVHLEGNEAQLLQAGDLVLFPRDLPHAISDDRSPPDRSRIGVPPECKTGEEFTSILCGYYIFESPATQVFLDALPDVVLLLDARNNPATAGVGHIIDAARVELETDYPGRNAALRDLARLLLLHLLRGRLAEASSTGYLAALGDPQISRALLLIHSRYGEDWTLETLAKEAGMSRTSFANRFHDYVGMPPARYLTAWRMQEATSLLENTLMSVGQIAEKCGYQSDISFRKAYKKVTGLTPKQVRSKGRGTLLEKTARLLTGPWSTENRS